MSTPDTTPKQMPIQRPQGHPHKGLTIPEPVYMAAYEVYCHYWSPQPALIDLEGRNCRGGFGMNELVAFLYAKQFPKEEWKQRCDEAWEGMNF